MILSKMPKKPRCSNVDRGYCRTEKYTDCTNERKNEMLEKIISAAFDELLQADNPKLLEKKKEAVQKILEKDKLTEIFVDDAIGDVCCEYENVIFRDGFLACVNCFRSLLVEEIVGVSPKGNFE